MVRGAFPAAARKWLLVTIVLAIVAAVGFGLNRYFASDTPDKTSASASASAANSKSTSRKRAGTKPLWVELTPSQQEVLAPLAPEWDQINPVRKKKWLELGNKITAMPMDEKQRMLDRIRDWVKLTPEQRKLARQNFTQTKKIKPEDKTAQWQEYQKLPEQKKKELAAKIERAKKQVANPPTKRDQDVKIVTPIKAPATSAQESSAPLSPPASTAPSISGH